MRTGFTCGAFDLLHAGHLYFLEQCKRNCDYLIVGLHIDPSIERKNKNKPIETLIERQIRLRSCKYIDEVIVYETEKDLISILNAIDIDVRFLGGDYSDKSYITVGNHFIKIKYMRLYRLHSSDLRKRL